LWSLNNSKEAGSGECDVRVFREQAEQVAEQEHIRQMKRDVEDVIDRSVIAGNCLEQSERQIDRRSKVLRRYLIEVEGIASEDQSVLRNNEVVSDEAVIQNWRIRGKSQKQG